MIPHLELHQHELEGLRHTLDSARRAFDNPNVSVVAIPLRPEELRNYAPPTQRTTFWDRFRRADRVVYVPLINHSHAS
jgi:hypothetical protein